MANKSQTFWQTSGKLYEELKMANKLNLVSTKTDGIKKDINTGIYYIYKSINNRYGI